MGIGPNQECLNQGYFEFECFYSSSIPVAVNGALAGKQLVKIITGYHRSCAITSGGELYCWGLVLNNVGVPHVDPFPVHAYDGYYVSDAYIVFVESWDCEPNINYDCKLFADGKIECGYKNFALPPVETVSVLVGNKPCTNVVVSDDRQTISCTAPAGDE